MLIYLLGLVFLSIFLSAVFTVRYFSKYRKLDKNQYTQVQKLYKQVKINNHPKQCIIDLDKLFHKTLQMVGYNGTFGEILKMEPNEIGDLQQVWKYHKLRNTLVHEFQEHDERFLLSQKKKYEKQYEILLSKIHPGKK